MLYEKIAKPLFLFRMDPERAHHFTIGSLRTAGNIPGALPIIQAMYATKAYPELQQTIWGMQISNPIGLAAGLDKNGEAAAAFSRLGFGFIEVGTVTPKGQPGNDLPRLFRLPEDEALINRMGFNNHGAEAMKMNLLRLKQRPIPIAVNIGKNKITPNEQAAQDYRTCLRILYGVGDFFVINISSPNTPNLRSLQHGDELSRLISEVLEERDRLAEEMNQPAKPVLVKIAPDLSDEELAQTVGILESGGVSGIIATNTTIARDGLRNAHAGETGGLSGLPLQQRSTEIIRQVYRLTKGSIPIIGCGGIATAQDAYEKIRAGASVVEVYTALIYKGPALMKQLNRELVKLLRQDGYSHISQAIGTNV